MLAVFTIGHSNRSAEDFVDLLQRASVGLVADVRSLPGSRANPQFNDDALLATLATAQIGYRHLAGLGGLRGRQRQAGLSPNLFWENRSFRNYADYALTGAFRAGLAELRALGAAQHVAIMCAEAVWWRCHRRIIADYLLVEDVEVLHILGPGHITPATLTPRATRTDDGLVYPAADGGSGT